MIRDLSETLREILRQSGVPQDLLDAQISFDRPVESFQPVATTINAFLFDIRENEDLRNSAPFVSRTERDAIVRRPPRRVRCSYLITAWPVSSVEAALQEHRLLTQVLQVLSRHSVIPSNSDLAKGKVKDSDPPVSLQVAASSSVISTSEFWSSLGTRLRASLTLEATISLPVFEDEPQLKLTRSVRVVAGERLPSPQVGLDPTSKEQVTAAFVFGRVVKDGLPVAGAEVSLEDPRVRVLSAEDGVFRIGPLRSGTYTINVTYGSSAARATRTIPAPDPSDSDKVDIVLN